MQILIGQKIKIVQLVHINRSFSNPFLSMYSVTMISLFQNMEVAVLYHEMWNYCFYFRHGKLVWLINSFAI
jgi:hypothetical protein